MIGGVTYRQVPTSLRHWIATLHRADFEPGRPIRVPALLGQVWYCSVPVRWLPPGRSAPAPLPTVALIGPTTAAFEVMVERPGHILGCGFWPLGWAELVRRDAARLADAAVDAAAVWPHACAGLAAGSGGTGEADETVWEALDRFTAALGREARPSADRDRIAAIDAWLATSGAIGDLCAQLGRSPRHVARITCRTHGGPPRLIAAKWRTLRAAAELGLGSPTGAWWSDRFADQSHCIREFHRFIGETPRGLTGRPAGIPYRVVADSWHRESDHPLALYRDEDAGKRS